MTKCEICNKETKRRTKKNINGVSLMICENCNKKFPSQRKNDSKKRKSNQVKKDVKKYEVSKNPVFFTRKLPKFPQVPKNPVFFTQKLPEFPDVPTHQIIWKKK